MSSKVGPKTGLYFTHYECFGHTSRVMAFGEVFKKCIYPLEYLHKTLQSKLKDFKV